MQAIDEQIDKYFESNPESKQRISREIHQMIELITQDKVATELKALLRRTLITYRNADDKTIEDFNQTHSLSTITGYEDQDLYSRNIFARTAFEYTRDPKNSLPFTNQQFMNDLVDELFEQALTNYDTFLCSMFRAMIYTYISSKK